MIYNVHTSRRSSVCAYVFQQHNSIQMLYYSIIIYTRTWQCIFLMVRVVHCA